jgi:hypothetical protein
MVAQSEDRKQVGWAKRSAPTILTSAWARRDAPLPTLHLASAFAEMTEDVDGRDKPGHDEAFV